MSDTLPPSGILSQAANTRERDEEKWNPVFLNNHAATKYLKQDDVSIKHHPALVLTVILDGTDTQIARLVKGDLDRVVAFNIPTDERVRLVASFDLQLGLVRHRSLLEHPPASIALADCLVWPLCLPGMELSVHPRPMAEIHRQDRAFKIAATRNSISTLCGLIADGHGVGFTQLPDVTGQRHAKRLIFVPLTDRRLTERLRFATRAGVDPGPELATVLALVSRITSEIAQGTDHRTHPQHLLQDH